MGKIIILGKVSCLILSRRWGLRQGVWNGCHLLLRPLSTEQSRKIVQHRRLFMPPSQLLHVNNDLLVIARELFTLLFFLHQLVVCGCQCWCCWRFLFGYLIKVAAVLLLRWELPFTSICCDCWCLSSIWWLLNNIILVSLSLSLSLLLRWEGGRGYRS